MIPTAELLYVNTCFCIEYKVTKTIQSSGFFLFAARELRVREERGIPVRSFNSVSSPPRRKEGSRSNDSDECQTPSERNEEEDIPKSSASIDFIRFPEIDSGSILFCTEGEFFGFLVIYNSIRPNVGLSFSNFS